MVSEIWFRKLRHSVFYCATDPEMSSQPLPAPADRAAADPVAPSAALLRHLARYHAWASEKLLAACDAVHPSENLRKDVGLPFLTVQRTVLHLVAAEALWWHRLTGALDVDCEVPLASLPLLWAGEPDGPQWDTIPLRKSRPDIDLAAERDPDPAVAPVVRPAAEFSDVAAAVRRQCRRWITFADNLTDDRAASHFEYADTAGYTVGGRIGRALLHVFNHGTHHRGQLSVGLRQLLRGGLRLAVSSDDGGAPAHHEGGAMSGGKASSPLPSLEMDLSYFEREAATHA